MSSLSRKLQKQRCIIHARTVHCLACDHKELDQGLGECRRCQARMLVRGEGLCPNAGNWQPIVLVAIMDWEIPWELPLLAAVCEEHRRGEFCDGSWWVRALGEQYIRDECRKAGLGAPELDRTAMAWRPSKVGCG